MLAIDSSEESLYGEGRESNKLLFYFLFLCVSHKNIANKTVGLGKVCW